MIEITVASVSKRYGRFQALSEVGLTVSAGEAVVIHGPSGSGKSTLLRLIAGLELPDRGEVYLDGELASRPGWALEPHRRGIGFVFQSPALWPHLTVAQNVLFGLKRWRRADAHDRVDELLAAVELSELAQRYPDELSGGEARRVALIRSLAPRPRLLLLDEPLTNLDPELKERLLAFVKQAVSASASTLLYVSHDPAEARAISPRAIELASGRLVRDRTEQPHGVV